jgi:hypothetical protein
MQTKKHTPKPKTEPNQKAGEGCPEATCSQLLDPATAPKDGTTILVAVGWPWLAPAIWDAESKRWSIAVVETVETEDGESWWWEHIQELEILGWIPWPAMPSGAPKGGFISQTNAIEHPTQEAKTKL